MADHEKHKKEYLSYYKSMRDAQGKPKRHTLTYAQYSKTTPQGIALSKTGIKYKKLKRLGAAK